MAATKRKRKSTANSTRRRTGPWFLPGYDAARGHGPPKGSGGRPPDDIKAFFEGLRDHPEFRKRLRLLALSDPDPDRARRFAMFLLDRTEGKPVQPIRHVDGGLGALKEMPDDRFLAYVHHLEAELAAARGDRARPQAREG